MTEFLLVVAGYFLSGFVTFLLCCLVFKSKKILVDKTEIAFTFCTCLILGFMSPFIFLFILIPLLYIVRPAWEYINDIEKSK